MGFKSVKIVQTAIINLASIPLQRLQLSKWTSTMFNNVNCFGEYPEIYASSVQSKILSDNPFIPYMGAIVLNTRQLYFNKYCYGHYNDDKMTMLDLLEGRSDTIEEPTIFGYEPKQEDQRKNFLYFEARKPAKIRGIDEEGKTVANGRVYVHIVPSGHIVVHIVTDYVQSVARKFGLSILLNESKPWAHASKWNWICSKLNLECKLYELFDNLLINLSQTLYHNEYQIPNNTQWYATVMLAYDSVNDVEKAEQEASKELQIRSELMNSKTGRTSFYRSYRNDGRVVFELPGTIDKDQQPNVIELLHSDCNLSYMLTAGYRERKKALGSFWKLVHIIEFSLFCKTVYTQYELYAQNETLRMKDLRLNRKKVAKREKIFGHDFYQADMLLYVMKLGDYSKQLSPYFQGMFSYVSRRNGMYIARDAMFSTLKDWEVEVEKWNDRDSYIKMILNQLKNYIDIRG